MPCSGQLGDDMFGIKDKIWKWIKRDTQSGHSGFVHRRGAVAHVIILDGTLASLKRGHRSHAGRVYDLLQEMGPSVSVYYEAGVQWGDWSATPDVITGRGINRQIRRAYGYLVSRYRPGDTIYLLGYSRGAYAVRSLAGMIDVVGLLRARDATVRNIRQAYRHYEQATAGLALERFRAAHCHKDTEIQMVGVWDTVRALGLRLPILWRFVTDRHHFHNHHLGHCVQHGYHALALDETRAAFAPVLWQTDPTWQGTLEQVWFRGAHGDVGGQLGDFEEARPLANISLVWMLKRAEKCGLPLPPDWRARFPTDPAAPSLGSWRGWGKVFLLRARRHPGRDPSERLHDSARKPDRPRAQSLLRFWQRGAI